jgi:hypothetical protein
MRKTVLILITLMLAMGLYSVKGFEREASGIPGSTETSYSEVTNQKTQSNEAFILTFGFIEDPTAQVDIYENYISVTVAWDTDITSLTPTMTISEGATIDYEFPTTMDFSQSVYFTVTAEDGVTTNSYMVWVYQEYQNPEIVPEVQYFGLQDPDDVNFTILWGSETEITQVYYYNWDDWDNYEVPLQEGTDYFVNGDILTISSNFILSLDPEVYEWLDFSAQFGMWGYAWFGIVVVETTTPYLLPANLSYDLTNPGDLFTTIVYLNANEVVSVSEGEIPLTEGEDYTIEGAWLFIHDAYLSENLLAVDDEVELTVVFDTEDESILTITTIESGIVNATIDPQSVTYVNDMPYYQDITITWNDASEVTQLFVTLIDEWYIEQFEWPYYSVTDNGDGTALLRIFFDEDDKFNKLSKGNSKAEEYSFVTIDISFDVGAPATFFMTLVWEYFEVNVTIVPEYAGWVYGDWEYSPGEMVYLEAYPSWGYIFVHWEDMEGEVLSTENPYVFIMPDYDVDLVAVFEESGTTYTVNYGVIGENGSLNAFANGYYINSGDQVTEGWNIEFNAYANWGYGVKEWRVNGAVVSGFTGTTFIYQNLQSDINVTVEFIEWEYPEIIPEYQLFSLTNPEDVDFYINWGSETEILNIYYYYEDDDDYYQVILQQGTDYYISGDVLTITSDFILSQEPEPFQAMQFSAEFGSGYYEWFAIMVLESTSPILIPDLLSYDFTNPGDLMTTIIFMTATEVVSISESGSPLVEDVDYHIDGTWLFIHDSYLSENLVEVDDELELTIVFDTDDEVTLTITAIESGVVNATIDPTAVTYYNEMPDYQDIIITWNDASEVTQMFVTVNFGWQVDQFEWPYYDVTDNGDGTALLRMYFDEGDKLLSAKSSSKEEFIFYVTVEISFDAGSPANFLITVIEEYYDVIVTIVPEGSGWVEGDWDYMPGEEVSLYAEAFYGYDFQNWRIDGAVVSSSNPYVFIMPNHDVYISAHFIESGSTTYTVTLAVNPAGAGVVTGAGSFAAGESVTVTATPNDGFVFVNWTTAAGAEVSTNSTYTFTMPASNVSLVANFESVSLYTVTFIVSDSQGAIEGAAIAVDGVEDDLITDGDGHASHTFLDGTYNFVVSHDGYHNYAGTFTVSGEDIDVVVTMTPVGIGTETLTHFNAYPNPFDGYIHFNSSERVSRVVVTNLIGQVVINAHITGSEQSLNTAILHKGVYLVTFHLENGKQVIRKMIKQ